MSQDNGNGKDTTPPKSEEQLNKERAERFAANPYSFIEMTELICGAIRNTKSQLGVSILVGNCKRSELNNAQIELDHRMSLARRTMDIQAEMEHSKIVPAKHGMLDFGRKVFGGK